MLPTQASAVAATPPQVSGTSIIGLNKRLTEQRLQDTRNSMLHQVFIMTDGSSIKSSPLKGQPDTLTPAPICIRSGTKQPRSPPG